MKSIFAQLKKARLLRGLVLIIVIILLGAGYIFWQKTKDRVFIDNSLVDAPIISISPQTTGKLTEVDVYDNQRVKKGDNLAIIGSETIHADTDGLIIMVNNRIGSIVNEQTPVVQMINTPNVRIAGTLDENKGLDNIRVGQIVSFTIDALPGKTFWGYVDEISPSAKQTQVAFTISSERPTQQFLVYAKFPADRYPEIKNGMSAKMVVYTKEN